MLSFVSDWIEKTTNIGREGKNIRISNIYIRSGT